MTFLEAVLVVLVTTAGIWDVVTGRIPNGLTYPACACGIAAAAAGAPPGLANSLLGFAVGLVPFLALYTFGSMGGGDVKLMAAVGALGGYPFVVNAMVSAVLFGGLIAALLVIWEGQTWAAARYVGSTVTGLFRPSRNRETLEVPRTVPFGVAICLGTFLALAAAWQGQGSPVGLLASLF